MVSRTSLRATGSMRFDVKTQTGTDGTIAAFHGAFDFFFQVCGGLTYGRDPQTAVSPSLSNLAQKSALCTSDPLDR